MNEIEPKFELGNRAIASSGEGEIIGHCFYDSQLFYVIDTRGNYIDEDTIYVTESEIERVTPASTYQLSHRRLGETFNDKGAIICGILIKKDDLLYYIDYPDFPSEFIRWDYWSNWR